LKWRSAYLELELVRAAVRPDHFPQSDGPSITKLPRPATKLMPAVTLCIGLPARITCAPVLLADEHPDKHGPPQQNTWRLLGGKGTGWLGTHPPGKGAFPENIRANSGRWHSAGLNPISSAVSLEYATRCGSLEVGVGTT
jgi:hypothetical protein